MGENLLSARHKPMLPCGCDIGIVPPDQEADDWKTLAGSPDGQLRLCGAVLLFGSTPVGRSCHDNRH